MAYKEISLIPGRDNDGSAAFCAEKMKLACLDASDLSNSIAVRLRPYAYLLADGKGVALVIRPDGTASVVGVEAEAPDAP